MGRKERRWPGSGAGMLGLCALAAFLSTAAATSTTAAPPIANGTFLVLAPAVFRPGLPYVAWLSLLSGEADNVVRLVLRDGHNQTIAQTFRRNLVPGTQERISLDGIPSDMAAASSGYTIFVKGETLGGRTLFQSSAPVRFNAKSSSVFVQTDKAIYKPGATVHFRVVAVGPSLRPLGNTTISVKVVDPASNVILQHLKETPIKGVISKDFELSDEPPLGSWRIEVETSSGFKTTKAFSVEKYVLPKFEVKVSPPAYSTIKEDIVVVVSAKYTYGKGVAGRVRLLAEMPWRYYGEGDYSPVEHSLALDEAGEASIRFSNAMLRERQLVNDYGYNRIKFTATVTEGLTGIERNATADLVVYKHPAKVTIRKPSETFKPGLAYDALVAVVAQDDTPIPESFARTALLKVEYEYPYDRDNERSPEFKEETITLDADGQKKVSLSPPQGIETIRIEVRYDSTGNHSDSEVNDIQRVSASKSPSQSYIQLLADQENGAIGQQMTFRVRTTSSVSRLTWLIMSRGRVLQGDSLQPVDNAAQIAFAATADMAPKSRLVVYGIRSENKEILVDAMDFKVEGLFKNKVSLDISAERAKPGAEVQFHVKADPESYVGLLAVDQSVLLLKSGNDITPEMVESDIEGYDTTGYGGGGWGGPWGPRILERRRRKRSIWFPWWGIGGKDAHSVFENAGIAVLTDALLYKEPMAFGYINWMKSGRPGPVPVMEAAMAIPDAPRAISSQATSSPVTRVRKEFPETWLWTQGLAGADGELRERAVVPDTITSWIASAFAINEESGLGVAKETAKLEVFRPFFIRLNTPYSVKQGESLALQVLVFNYMPETQWVTVVLDHGEGAGFDFVPSEQGSLGEAAKEKPVKAYNARKIRVSGGGGSASIFFPILPTKIGEVRLKLTATSNVAGDAIQRSLLVEPEGHRVDRNLPIVMDMSEAAEGRFERSIQLDFPPEAVPGSQRATFSLIGDVMGPVLSTAEGLVRMPYGCGEQNMLNFVPNIVVVKYLTATQRLTDALKKKATKYMEAGYQRELNYKRSDSSFSAFGEQDEVGSTWLTAFVVRSFKQASPYIFVDSAVLNDSIAFLRSQQKENGEFAERGQVHHKDMQGGSGESGVPLTAYVLIALLENGVQNADALNYVEQNMEREKDSAYSMAIIAYALKLAGSARVEEAANILEGLAKSEGGAKFWSDSVGEEELDEEQKRLTWAGPRPVDVEATSYALLGAMHNGGDAAQGLPIVRWLTSKRNALGGYSSTQDTVMALQALGAYAEAAYSPNFDLSVSVENGPDVTELAVGPTNSIVLQQTELENLSEPVKLSATGSGMAFGQVGWSYYVKEAPTAAEAPFRCDQETQAASANDVLLSLCCRYSGPGGKSNMAVLEVDSLSGFALEAEKLNGLTHLKGLQRVELEKSDSKANIYFESLDASPLCVNLTSQRVFPVAEQKPASALLYDYYEPKKRLEMSYTASQRRSLHSACPTCWDNIPQASDAAAASQDETTTSA